MCIYMCVYIATAGSVAVAELRGSIEPPFLGNSKFLQFIYHPINFMEFEMFYV